MNMSNQAKEKEKENRRVCPYCEEEIFDAGLPYCKPCGVALLYCTRCNISVEREAKVCPRCGGELEWK